MLSEHRISKVRRDGFLGSIVGPVAPEVLVRAVNDYREVTVRHESPEKTYAHESNGQNFVTDGEVPPDLELATCVNVTRAVEIFREHDGKLEDLHHAIVEDATADAKTALIKRLLTTMEGHLDKRPVWVAQWTHYIASIEQKKVFTWNADVGVARPKGHWQAVFKYPRGFVPLLIRPTILDGASEFHHTSPPSLHPARGGFAMSLRSCARPLIPEWIHPPVRLTPDCWTGWLAPVDAMCGMDIPEHRAQHGGRLRGEFPDECKAWLGAG
jgi:hypothetical protein